ncbi:MAG: ABC transporter substrate-binding protein [Bacteroidetes bacterium]|nr:ABC transporter substrate-binding protein [Bacteroidota bacterium]
MRKFHFLPIILLFIYSCKDDQNKIEVSGSLSTKITYAKGFEIENFNDHKVLKISNPWPGADKIYTYLLKKNDHTIEGEENYDGIVQIPVQNLVVTSTTHIPSLEMLGVENLLVGFPNLNYISSEKTRRLIENDKIKELGKNEDINTEVLIDLSPDVVVTFAVEGGNKTVSTIQKTGIPVIYNSDWTETHPLGKAEWVKFFGALVDKEKVADSIFSEIENSYNTAKALAAQAMNKPTVLSGAMYKDIWYLPQGDSWAARFIEDANGEYLWKESKGTGSHSLNLETVLDKGKEAQYWIGPGQFTSFEQMNEMHTVYSEFEAFQQKRIYSFTTIKGATGGVLYYELAPNRPDIVLKDIIKILHPQLLPEHKLYFFSLLE